MTPKQFGSAFQPNVPARFVFWCRVESAISVSAQRLEPCCRSANQLYRRPEDLCERCVGRHGDRYHKPYWLCQRHLCWVPAPPPGNYSISLGISVACASPRPPYIAAHPFTPPTAPVAAVPDALLLMNFDNDAVYDASSIGYPLNTYRNMYRTHSFAVRQ